MPKQRSTSEKIIRKLREADVWLVPGRTALNVCKTLGMSEKIYLRNGKIHGDQRTDQAKQLRVHPSEVAQDPEQRADVYPCTLLVHGACTTILAARCRKNPRNSWLANLLTYRHADIATVAPANKHVRAV